MTNRRALMTIGLLGIPFDGNSSYLRGAALAPPAIREALRSGSSNLWTEDGVDLGEAGAFADAGDLTLAEETARAFEKIEDGVGAALERTHSLICLGGDHSITYPIIKAFHERYRDLTLLHFDAHPDLYDELDGNRFSHACQFARILEEGLVRRLVQVGIRTLNAHQRSQAERFGVEVITMRKLAKLARLELEGPLFISFDMDVFDPAFAPGVSHYEPGGMSVREVLSVIQSLRVYVVGADIVEYNPTRDRHAQTAMVCAKVLKEIAAAMLRRGAEPTAGWP
jgi:arginase